MVYGLLYLFLCGLEGEQPVQQAECCRGPSSIPGKPRLHVVHLVEDLIDDFGPCGELQTVIAVIV